jgi:hypothetical protein
MTGSLPSTSAAYIFCIPAFTLSHVFTAEMSSSIGECQRSDAVFTCKRGVSTATASQNRRTHGVDELDARKVHVLARVLGDDVCVVDRARADVLVPAELRRAEEERQEMVVVEPPHAVRARGLEPVRGLQHAHYADVPARGRSAALEAPSGARAPPEDAKDERTVIRGADDAEALKALPVSPLSAYNREMKKSRHAASRGS